MRYSGQGTFRGGLLPKWNPERGAAVPPPSRTMFPCIQRGSVPLLTGITASPIWTTRQGGEATHMWHEYCGIQGCSVE